MCSRYIGRRSELQHYNILRHRQLEACLALPAEQSHTYIASPPERHLQNEKKTCNHVLPRLTKVRKKEGQDPKWNWSKMAEGFMVACYVGHQPGGSYRTLSFSFKCMYFFSISPWHKICGGVHSRPCYWSKSQTFTNNTCQILSKTLPKTLQTQEMTALPGFALSAHFAYLAYFALFANADMRGPWSDLGHIKRKMKEHSLSPITEQPTRSPPGWCPWDLYLKTCWRLWTL